MTMREAAWSLIKDLLVEIKGLWQDRLGIDCFLFIMRSFLQVKRREWNHDGAGLQTLEYADISALCELLKAELEAYWNIESSE
jgi:hypothetical protein